MMLARDLIIPVVPAARRATIREARIDVAIAAPAGDARQALAIGAARAGARIAPTAALKAIGIIVRGRSTGAGYRRGARRQDNQYCQHRIPHEFVSYLASVASKTRPPW